MNTLKQHRSAVRGSFTKTLNKLKIALQTSPTDPEEIEIFQAQLEDKWNQLKMMDEEILVFMKEEDCSQEDIDKEYDVSSSYSENLVAYRIKTKKLLEREMALKTFRDSDRVLEIPPIMQRPYKLPEIELKKFGGDLRDWLQFWGQFKKIDEDMTVDPQDKFQYLLQATISKSKARDIVESFPPTAENYPKAVGHLKQRFGREETLIEVYVRDLLRLILDNATETKKKWDLSALYDKLETQLRALESLGVTKEKYAAMLYPLVESCLPSDILQVWERSRGHNLLTDGKVKNDLTSLMNFLRIEVEGEQRIALARNSFVQRNDKFSNHYFKKHESEKQPNIATAVELFCGHSERKIIPKNPKKHSRHKDIERCLFCDKPHLTKNCFSASSMTLDKKKAIIMENNCCFTCLRKGHKSSQCRSPVKCIICERRHYIILCPQLPSSTKKPSKENKEEKFEDNTLSNHSCNSDVLLQTLLLKLHNGKKQYVVRALIDTGSQKSFIDKEVVKHLKCKSIGHIKIVHKLFGALETSETTHEKYRLRVSSMDEDFYYDIDLLDQDKICTDIKGVPNGPWINELKENDIKLYDIEGSIRKDQMEIRLLIGADVAGKLLTGRLQKLKSGPVALETLLGWTLMGEIPIKKQSDPDVALHVISLFLKDDTIANLRKHDVVSGITDPMENKSELVDDLPHNKQLVKKRVNCTEKKLFTLGQKIQWKFNPPRWGGWWERLTQMLKRLLQCIVRSTSPFNEEMQSIWMYWESPITSTLTFLSGDAKNLIPLVVPISLNLQTGCVLINLDMIIKRWEDVRKPTEELNNGK